MRQPSSIPKGNALPNSMTGGVPGAGGWWTKRLGQGGLGKGDQCWCLDVFPLLPRAVLSRGISFSHGKASLTSVF